MLTSLLAYLQDVERRDKKIILTLCNAFRNNARMRVLIGEKGAAGIKAIMLYCYLMVKKWGGIFTSRDQYTYLLFYQKSKFYVSWRDGIRYLYLALFVIGPGRLGTIYKREQLIRKVREQELERQAHQDFLYVWFLAQKKEYRGINGLLEAKQYIIDRSRELRLPIYMETTEKRLVRIYERIGFTFYEELEDVTQGVKVWFGRRDLV